MTQKPDVMQVLLDARGAAQLAAAKSASEAGFSADASILMAAHALLSGAVEFYLGHKSRAQVAQFLRAQADELEANKSGAIAPDVLN
jgi:hypothetical protein